MKRKPNLNIKMELKNIMVFLKDVTAFCRVPTKT